ncbi:MAG: rane protein [Bacteroidota bacterium]|nr:rane protein [Bacteroidota bacterium]
MQKISSDIYKNITLKNYYNILLCVLFLFGSHSLMGFDKDMKVPALSPLSSISLLTVGRADDEIYQNFGHTAIRIKDPVFGWDLVYNYGTFNFSEPGFLKKFIQCKLMYYVSVDDYEGFEEMYRDENRWIREQPLNLTQEQKQLLFERLTVNAREENKYYRYDFLYDNCSTRPCNIVLSLFKIKKYKPHEDDKATYRQLIHRNVGPGWLGLGMDLLIGIPTDKKAGFGRTFLPNELMELFDHAIVDGKPLVTGNNLILDVVPESRRVNWFIPNVVFWILFIVIFIVQIKTAVFSRFKIIPLIYFIILGLFGWLFLFMWFGTLHTSTKWNLNILWAMPLNVPIMFLALKKNMPTWTSFYIKAYRIILISLLVGWYVNPQTYNTAVIPLILIAILFTSIFLPVPRKEDFKKRWFG